MLYSCVETLSENIFVWYCAP